MAAAVEFEHITKRYESNGVLALDDVSFPIEEGRILCVAGENGAGKSTLMRILSGMETPTSGVVRVLGTALAGLTPARAAALGIGMLHQNMLGIDAFTVEENALLGHERTLWGTFIDRRRTRAAVRDAIERFGLDLDPGRRVGDLSVGQKQQAEILKLLVNGARILILDEPTAVLASDGIERLFRDLRTLAGQGRTVVLITHSLAEIRRVSDTVAVLREGRLAGFFPTRTRSEEETGALMFGRARGPRTRPPAGKGGRTVLSCRGLGVRKRSMDRPLLQDISFDAHAGEILGFAALPGNGLGVLEGTLGGFIRTSTGTIILDGKDVTGLNTRGLRKLGLAYVPSSKIGMGANPSATVQENLMPLELGRLSWGPFLSRRRLEAFARERIGTFSVRARAADGAGTLSGGNLQKLVLAREIPFCRSFILFSQPFWGLDEEAAAFVRSQIVALRDRGAAVVLLTYNIDEALLLSDRLGILHRGRLAGIFAAGALERAKIGRLMAGGGR